MAKCPIDGTKFNFLNCWELKDGNICKVCGEKAGLTDDLPNAISIARTYTINEIKDLIDSGDSVSDKDFQEQQNQITQSAHAIAGDTNLAHGDPEYRAKLNLNDLDPKTQKAVNHTMDTMSNFGLARLLSTVRGPMERYQITLQQTQIDQNWILIQQQDETNKLIRQLIQSNVQNGSNNK